MVENSNMTFNGDLLKQEASGADNGPIRAPLPVVDLHCDMLSYLAEVSDAHPANGEDIGCAVPFMRTGNVKLQVMAIYSAGGEASPNLTKAQSRWFRRLTAEYGGAFHHVSGLEVAKDGLYANGTGILASVENASALCGDNEPLDVAFRRLKLIEGLTGRIVYISLTHHGENRFGGGNNTTIGLKDDGRVLLDYLDGKGIAVDLSHSSDALAYGMIDHIDRRGLRIPIVASHSNFRSVFDHVRNLPDELAQVVIGRKGLIGMNFVRAFLSPDDPSSLTRHIRHGLELGGEQALCFGADFFYSKSHPDKSRIPFFFEEHGHAGKYQQILRSLESELGLDQARALAYGNAMRFLERVWPERNGW